LEKSLLSSPAVQSVSICRTAIGGGSYTATVVAEGRAEPLTPRIFGVDQEYFETYGISTIAGRTFIKNSNVDSLNVVVNESFIKLLGWENPIGKRFHFQNEEPEQFTVIGVIKDFHYYAPSNSKIEASIMQLNLTQRNNATIKLTGNNIPQAIAHIENVWNKLSTETPFDYYFVDQWFDNQYKKEQQLLKITSAYSIISLVLCGLGLFGLTGLVVQGRLKEIGIRKVLGANMGSLINMINRPFMAIMLISVLVGSPIAYLLAEKWLNQFEYHIQPGISAFLLAWIITSGLSIIIISISSVRASLKNPTDVLSQE